MIELTDAKWQEINTLVKKIYESEMDSLLDEVTGLLMELIPSSRSMYHLYRTAGVHLSPYEYHSTNIDASVLEEYKKYEDLDYICWYTDVPEPRVYRDTDLISEDLRLNTELMKRWLLPNDLYYSLGCNIAYGGQAFAAISLFKGQQDGDFTDEDVRVLEIINEHLSIRFFQASKEKEGTDNDAGSLIKKYKLTEKEMQILHLVEKGCLRDHLPEKLFISENTLKKHLYNIYRKLGINKFEELIQFTIDQSDYIR